MANFHKATNFNNIQFPFRNIKKFTEYSCLIILRVKTEYNQLRAPALHKRSALSEVLSEVSALKAKTKNSPATLPMELYWEGQAVHKFASSSHLSYWRCNSAPGQPKKKVLEFRKCSSFSQQTQKILLLY